MQQLSAAVAKGVDGSGTPMAITTVLRPGVQRLTDGAETEIYAGDALVAVSDSAFLSCIDQRRDHRRCQVSGRIVAVGQSELDDNATVSTVVANAAWQCHPPIDSLLHLPASATTTMPSYARRSDLIGFRRFQM